MISRTPQRERSLAATGTKRRFGPWPWYLTAADFVGLDIDLVDDIAGDLVEECAGLSVPARLLKRVWCAGQILRSLPYLAIGTLRRGHPHARRRLLVAIGALMATAATGVAAVQMHVGPPARITGDRGFDANNIVINNLSAVQMPIRALDARGHTVTKAAIRYERFGGDAIRVSESGAVSCLKRGSAVVEASVADVTSLVTVNCFPVSKIYATPTRFDFLPGDPPQAIHVEAVDGNAHLVGDLRGSVGIVDTSIAALHRGLIAPRGVGSTRLSVSVGDARVDLSVVVHELVQRFDDLKPSQRNVAMPLRLSPGDTLHIPVPAGTIWVKWLPRDGTTAHPNLTAEGPGYCHMDAEAFIRWLPAGEYGAYCYMSEGARVRVALSSAGNATMNGALLLQLRSR